METTPVKSTPPKLHPALLNAARLITFSVIIALIYLLKSVVLPLLFSIMIAVPLYPVAARLEKWKLPRMLSSLISLVIGVVVLGGVVYLIVTQVLNIGKDGMQIVGKVQGVIDAILSWLHDSFGIAENTVTTRLREGMDGVLSNAAGYVTTAFSSVGSVLAGLVIVPLFVFFMLYYRDFFREFFFIAFKRTPQEKVNRVLNDIYTVLNSYLVGLITVMGIVAILNTIGLLVMGVQYAWFFGILASLLMLIPYIGIAIGSLLPALFAIATMDSYWYALGIIGWFQVVQFLEANIITPNIVGSKVSINPLMAIVSLLLGGILLGLGGLILALPLVASLKIVFDAMPDQQHFGFLIGEPEKYHLKRESRRFVLGKWRFRRKKDQTPAGDGPDSKSDPSQNG